MEVKHDINGGNKAEKLKSLVTDPRSPPSACVKLWAILCSTMVLLWVCVVQITIQDNKLMEPKYSFSYSYPYSVPPEINQSENLLTMSTGVFKNNGYLMISSNGGLNQMRTGICDMVVIARYLNVTLIVPDLDNKSYWNDNSEFKDIFDVDFFISSLRDEVPILKELPPEQKRKVESESLYTMYPISFSSLRYYYSRILPRIQKNQVVLFTLTDGRLANNGLPEEIQQLRCRVNYKALRFTPQIDELGRKIVRLLRQKGPFLVLHLRYEMDMLAFTGCAEGCSRKEIQDLIKWRYSHHPEWQHRGINSRRRSGLCPLTPEETALVLQALGIDQNITIYIAAGNIYGGERRMASLRAAYPNLVSKETITDSLDLRPFQNHSNQMAALDYIVAVESDIFVPSYGGNMAKAVEGHRRYLGFRKTILPNRRLLVNLIDQYKNGTLSWIEFSILVKASHADRMGKPTKRLEIPGHPREEDYFYSNPQECLPSLA